MQEPAPRLAGNLSNIGVRPIRDQVVVRQDPKQERLKSGLYLPDIASRELQEDIGTVLGVGPDALSVQVGDRVIFRRRSGSALMPDPREGGPSEWKDVLILRDEDLVAVLED